MYTNLSDSGESIIAGKDSIVIVDNFQSIRGGRTLDVTGYLGKVIQAGHVVIKETATGNYKPMPTTEASTGNIATFGSITGGSGYANATYNGVPLIGGTGKGAYATIVVGSGAVTTVTKVVAGYGYTVGDVLTADPSTIGGTGSGFSVPVATIASVTAAYRALPAGHTYAGIVIASVLTKRPMVGILVRGTVNPAACPYPMAGILSAVQAALPLIDFRQD